MSLLCVKIYQLPIRKEQQFIPAVVTHQDDTWSPLLWLPCWLTACVSCKGIRCHRAKPGLSLVIFKAVEGVTFKIQGTRQHPEERIKYMCGA